MRDAQKPDHISLNTLVNRLKEGRFVIPDFQREFEWQPWDIRTLMRSIFLDYYIGSLLLWKGKNENFSALTCENIYGYNGEGSWEYIVLDGQQRLTAIYYAFLAPNKSLPNRAKQCLYFIKVDNFMNEEYDNAFTYEWQSKRLDKLLQNAQEQFENHIFPLSTIGRGGWELPNWTQGYIKYWEEKANNTDNSKDKEKYLVNVENATNFGEYLKQITEQYQVSYIELDKDLALEKVCDIFTQINSKGVRLDIFDLINALLKPKGLQLKHMWREASGKLEFVNSEKMNVYILQVMSILKQAYCSPRYLYYLIPGQEKTIRGSTGTRTKEVLVKDSSEFESLWNNSVDALDNSVKMLNHPQEFGVTSSQYLPYISILPVFASLQQYIKSLDSSVQLDAQRKFRYWYWASIFTTRYSGSVESTSARDFLDVKDWINNSSLEPALIQEFKQVFKNLDFHREVKRGSAIYNAIFNLLVLQGARDWMTGNIPQHNDLDDHHIVPSSWGSKNLKNNSIHTILNRTPLTSDTNRKIIGDKLPNEYLPALLEKNGEKTVRQILESHFISEKAQSILLRNPFTPEDYEEFINERYKTIVGAIENLLIKERIDLSPDLRDLDTSLEKVELDMRKHVVNVLESQSLQIPSHILEKVETRVSNALKKNPSLDDNYLTSLQGMLDFADLRDIQDIIVTKSIWPSFQGIFTNKELFNSKFTQLSELRNGIRHSRCVDEITKKEGEAAIIWFTGCLNNK